MTLSKIEQLYYINKRKRAQGFISRRTAKFNEEVMLWRHEIEECDEKLRPLGTVEEPPLPLEAVKPKPIDDIAERDVPRPPGHRLSGGDIL